MQMESAIGASGTGLESSRWFRLVGCLVGRVIGAFTEGYVEAPVIRDFGNVRARGVIKQVEGIRVHES